LADKLYVRRPNLDTLYIASARFTLSPAHLAAHPHEGALLAADVGVRGLGENLFGRISLK
jgi:sugar lactone lactonase YvrE